MWGQDVNYNQGLAHRGLSLCENWGNTLKGELFQPPKLGKILGDDDSLIIHSYQLEDKDHAGVATVEIVHQLLRSYQATFRYVQVQVQAREVEQQQLLGSYQPLSPPPHFLAYCTQQYSDTPFGTLLVSPCSSITVS